MQYNKRNQNHKIKKRLKIKKILYKIIEKLIFLSQIKISIKSFYYYYYYQKFIKN